MYCKEHGHELSTTAMGTVFEIKLANKSRRVGWCKQQKELLKEHSLGSWEFEDEVEIEEHLHPKCK